MKARRLWFVFLLLVIGPRNEHTVRAQEPKAEPGGVSYWKGSEAFARTPRPSTWRSCRRTT
jgi:hypothetical protein